MVGPVRSGARLVGSVSSLTIGSLLAHPFLPMRETKLGNVVALPAGAVPDAP
jgi:hypothetical protein